MATCDAEGVWTVSCEWIAWATIKGEIGKNPVAAITHAIMKLEKQYCGKEHDKVISEKAASNYRQFKLYQITKTLVKPDEGEE